MFKYRILPIIAALSIIFGCLIVITLTVKNRSDLETYQKRYERLSGVMEYKYSPSHNNINIIVLHLKNPGLENNDTYMFRISDNEGNTRVNRTFTGFNVGDPSDLRIQFDPIADSGNTDLIIRLEDVTGGDKPISVGVDENGKVTFSSYFRSDNVVKGLFGIIENLILHMCKDFLFFAFLSVTLLVIVWKRKSII